MAVYRGIRTPDGCKVTMDGAPLDPANHVRNHSPDGFNWGYGGSGPAQLALALLVSELGRPQAESLYQVYKWLVIAPILEDSWTITSDDIRAAVREIIERRAASWAAKERAEGKRETYRTYDTEA